MYFSIFVVVIAVAAAIFLLIVAILPITTEITSEKYLVYGSNSNSSWNGSTSNTNNNNNSMNNNNNNTMTSLPAAADFNFAAVGDWGCTSNTNNTVNNIVDKNPELVLALGDYSYNTTSDDCWFKIVKPIEDKMKIQIGNHDHLGLGQLYRYMNHFGVTEQYYSFDYRNIHFLALSTEIPFLVNSTQYNFVKNDLSKAASDPNIDWIIVYYHRQMYTIPSIHSAIALLRSTYHPLFEQYGVDLVLQAHNHNYQRTYPIKFNSTNPKHPIETSTNKTTYTDLGGGQIFATVGTGGKNLYPFKDQKDGKKENNNHYYYAKQYLGYGILNVDITNNGKTLTGKFYANNNGTIIDQFTITKPSRTT
jgi:Calcineurin-like phosphoesterase